MVTVELSAIEICGSLDVESTTNIIKCRESGTIIIRIKELPGEKLKSLLGKASRKINGSFNGCKSSETGNYNELSVVGQLEGAADGLKFISGDIGELDIAVEGEGLSNFSQLWEGDWLESIVDEGHSLVDIWKLRERDRSGITDGNIPSPHKVRESNNDILAVKFDRESVGDIRESNSNILKLLVVVDVEGLGGFQVDTIETAKLGICN